MKRIIDIRIGGLRQTPGRAKIHVSTDAARKHVRDGSRSGRTRTAMKRRSSARS